MRASLRVGSDHRYGSRFEVMRLLHTRDLTFHDTWEGSEKKYAILSHRWSAAEHEVSFQDFLSGRKRDSTGYAKIKRFLELAYSQGYEYGWVDTCCIDKTSSSELSEAINSMFKWYEQAALCIVYLPDVDHVRDIKRSEWPRRGWTLQELIAPPRVHFVDRGWRHLGTRIELSKELSSATGIDPGVLTGDVDWTTFSVAQRMSWAAPRTTSRLEDQAYCLLGLFNINMPLLYGEGARAFRRLQEEILASGEDTSIFAWDCHPLATSWPSPTPSMFAPAPAAFADSGDIFCGFNSLRMLFESTNRGFVLLVHRTYCEPAINMLLKDAKARVPFLGVTVPLGCYRKTQHSDGAPTAAKGVYLQLAKDGGKWRRIGTTTFFDHRSMVRFSGTNSGIYDDQFIRVYIHNDRVDQDALIARGLTLLKPADMHKIRYINVRDTNRDANALKECAPWRCCRCKDTTATGSRWCAHCCHTSCKECSSSDKVTKPLQAHSGPPKHGHG